MKRFLALALLAAVAISSIHAATTSAGLRKPDFAYPKTVIANSEKALKSALDRRDGIATVRALANMALAQSAIGNDNLPPTVRRIESIMVTEKSDVTRSLLAMLLADIYSDIYNYRRYDYNERNLPLRPFPADYNEWSGEQFRFRIDSLCSVALSNPEALQREPLARYSDIITAPAATLVYYPTLYDFAAHYTIDTRSSLTPFNNCCPLLYLTSRAAFIAMPIVVPSSAQAAAILDTFKQWTKFHSGDVAPLINVDLQRINFVANALYANQRDMGEGRVISLLSDLYKRYSDTEYAGDVICTLSDRVDITSLPDSTLRKVYEATGNHISRFPAYSRINCLKNIKKRISEAEGNVETPVAVAPGKDFKLRIYGRNMSTNVIDFYTVSPKSRSDNYIRATPEASRLIKSVVVNSPGTVPFRVDTTISVTLPNPGYYVAVPRNTSRRGASYRIIRCSALALGATTLFDRASLFVVNPVSGTPLPGISLTKAAINRNDIYNALGNTDSEGILRTTLTEPSYYAAQTTSDKYSAPICLSPDRKDEQTDTAVNVLTDLAIYHPGDTIRWVNVAYSYNFTTRQVLPGATIKPKIYLPNGEQIEAEATTTDEFGRATGRFVLPASGLTGNARIIVSAGHYQGSTTAMVSDYKLPTFAAEVKSVETLPENVVIEGEAKTYSGIAVQDAKVTLEMSAARSLWWSRTDFVDFYTIETTSDVQGRWRVEIPRTIFAYSPAPDGIFRARFTVSSTAGENRQCQRVFTLGETLAISATLPGAIDISNPFGLNVKVVAAQDGNRSFTRRISYRLINQSSKLTAKEGSFMTDNATVDWSMLKPGSYAVTFSADSAESVTLTTILYLPSGTTPPVEQPLWSPANGTTQTVDNGHHTSIIYSTAAPESHVLLTLSSNITGKIYEQRWLKVSRGMHTQDVKMADGIDHAVVYLTCTSDFHTSTAWVKLTTPASQRCLAISSESLRDHLIPGDTEHWSFHTSISGEDASRRSAVMLRMYNSALKGIDGLYIPSWQISLREAYRPTLCNIEPMIGGTACTWISSHTRGFDCRDLQTPDWQLYGRSFTSGEHHYYSVKLTSRALGASAPAVMMKNEMKMADSASDLQEEAVAESSVLMTDDTGSDNGDNKESTTQNEPQFSYRNAETPIAFFAPTLTTDENSRLTYTFTVPNANTTWDFGALAYTKDMLTASMNREMVANKPVMIQPNLPRFIRIGDSARVLSTVVNNSAVSQSINVITESFDPATNRVISSADTTVTLQPGTTSVVGFRLTSPDADSPFIGFRIKAVGSENHADGEQAILPVLPFTTPVIDTYPFYLSPDSADFSLKLPAMPVDAKVTLQFCENPVWYVATALPGLRSGDMTTAPQAASALYSAAVAQGLLHDHQSIAKALKEWTSSNRSDSTLVSMLNRNADLKTMLLNATPWMMDAASDTERMERLALLFDHHEIDATITKAIDLLQKLQRNDGGFAWTPQINASSEWSTTEVLTMIGRLNRQKWLPKDKRLSTLTAGALAYVEKAANRDWRKYPDSDFTYYVELMDLWPDYQLSTTSRSIISATVQRIIAGWKKLSLGGKARAALILWRHGNKAVANRILSSIDQYAMTSPAQGMWWPSVGDAMSGSMSELAVTSSALEAYSEITPGSKNIERICQWLILQRENRNWGTSATASQVVAAILSAVPQWAVSARGCDIAVGAEPVEPDDVENTLGYFRTSVASLSPSGKLLTIHKNSATPAWGAVYCQYTAAATDVKPAKCEALSIEKNYLVLDADGKWSAITRPLRVGDRLKVLLTVKASRALQYVAITDDRATCLEPVEQLPAPLWSEGICFYRENRSSSTNMFVTSLPKGTYLLSYELWVNNAGQFTSGIATAQSQYAPQITAHSGGNMLQVENSSVK